MEDPNEMQVETQEGDSVIPNAIDAAAFEVGYVPTGSSGALGGIKSKYSPDLPYSKHDPAIKNLLIPFFNAPSINLCFCFLQLWFFA